MLVVHFKIRCLGKELYSTLGAIIELRFPCSVLCNARLRDSLGVV